MKRACVIGWPISHSRSPIIHNYWLRLYGISGSYDRRPVAPDALAEFLNGLAASGYVGCNVTLPHKEAAFSLVRPADPTTERLAAVNTIYVRDRQLLGTNTDGEGFVLGLKSQVQDFEFRNVKAVILGAGGAAAAICAALIAEGVSEVCVLNRTPTRSEALQRRFGPPLRVCDWEARSDSLEGASLLVNTTTLGMTGQPELDIRLDRLGHDAVVSDIVYSPLHTPLLRLASGRGLRIADGLGMLLHQAVRGFELWFGRRPEVTPELYNLVARDIEPGLAR